MVRVVVGGGGAWVVEMGNGENGLGWWGSNVVRISR